MKNKIFIMNTMIILLSAAAFVTGQDSALKQANKHYDRGLAAVESAVTKEDLEDAVKEFEEARSLASGWADVYYNLGMVYEKLERYKEAVENLKHYIQLAPDAEDVNEVETMINKIEYKIEKAGEKENKFNVVVGTWDRYDPETRETLDNFTFILKDDGLYVQTFGGTEQGQVTVPANFDGSNLTFTYLDMQSLYSSEVTHTYKLKNPKLMEGTIRVNILSKQQGFPVQLGLNPAMPMELHKR
jgi:tetratricopeptide (TPR) repeat protein